MLESPKPLAAPQRGAQKVACIPIKVVSTDSRQRLPKPPWIRARFPGTPEIHRLQHILRKNRLHTVCEEAGCPNLGECFGQGTATFMIMGAICTRRCPFCNVGHGRPTPLDAEEPIHLAQTVAAMGLKYVVLTSVNRDDLRDGGAAHFAACIRSLRTTCPGILIEILTPDFRGRAALALEILAEAPPDVFNHNLETIPRLYRHVRPGADYYESLELLRQFKILHPGFPTKSGLMLGLGETLEEVYEVMEDLRRQDVEILTVGQYLQPSVHHLPVARYASPEEFAELRRVGEAMGFIHVAAAPLVRSSYRAEEQAYQAGVT